ncbi:Hypothetical protein NTJ_06956 [Nesidiocoris tenuis]|uniref:Uncharacterized protein n=1 Tax=Nesidiocoris tenuis TaxID=355587 RepID=A0ABN7APL2_9HEMI|nr:Hypothetical protein NTJ_06956 [Nesidiocoris tenuis]
MFTAAVPIHVSNSCDCGEENRLINGNESSPPRCRAGGTQFSDTLFSPATTSHSTRDPIPVLRRQDLEQFQRAAFRSASRGSS